MNGKHFRQAARSAARLVSGRCQQKILAAWPPRSRCPARQAQPEYTPHVDTADYIVVVNAAKLRVTAPSRPARSITAIRATGRCLRDDVAKMQQRFPGACCKSVKGMLPKGPLGYAMIKKLKISAGGGGISRRSSRRH